MNKVSGNKTLAVVEVISEG